MEANEPWAYLWTFFLDSDYSHDVVASVNHANDRGKKKIPFYSCATKIQIKKIFLHDRLTVKRLGNSSETDHSSTITCIRRDWFWGTLTLWGQFAVSDIFCLSSRTADLSDILTNGTEPFLLDFHLLWIQKAWLSNSILSFLDISALADEQNRKWKQKADGNIIVPSSSSLLFWTNFPSVSSRLCSLIYFNYTHHCSLSAKYLLSLRDTECCCLHPMLNAEPYRSFLTGTPIHFSFHLEASYLV